MYAQAGKNNAFDTTISEIVIDDGILDLYFSAVKYGEGYEYAGPFLNGIEINSSKNFLMISSGKRLFYQQPVSKPFQQQTYDTY